MVEMKKASFNAYMEAYKKQCSRSGNKAYMWPHFIINDGNLQTSIIKEPSKYVNWMIWILKTAPEPKSELDEKCKTCIENLLAEALEVNKDIDYIDTL